MIDRTCAECERLLQAYEYATQCQLIIVHRAAVETGLEVLVQKASNRCEEARNALDNHEAAHSTSSAQLMIVKTFLQTAPLFKPSMSLSLGCLQTAVEV